MSATDVYYISHLEDKGEVAIRGRQGPIIEVCGVNYSLTNHCVYQLNDTGTLNHKIRERESIGHLEETCA